MLDNREIAILVWTTLFFEYVLIRPGGRAAVQRFLRAFLHRSILTAYGLMLAYVALVVYGLESVGLWKPHQLKDTLIWLLVVGAAAFFRLPDTADDPIYFKEAIKDNLKVIAIIEFIMGRVTASLAAELILVPFATILGLLIVFAEHLAARESRHALTLRYLNAVAILLGAGILLYTIVHLIRAFVNVMPRPSSEAPRRD